MKKKYLARRVEGYTLEPLFDKDGLTWQSHHVTNPALIRLSGEKRAFLGYRAGGDRDHYCIGNVDVHSSSLGLAVLNETATAVVHRFPLPIMRIRRTVSLPQSPDEYPAYLEQHGKDVSVMHDFRFYEHQGYLYCIYHDGTITTAFDRIRRMPVADFLNRVDRSISLLGKPVAEIAADWDEIWPDSAWENAGCDGGTLLFPMIGGKTSGKTDIAYFKLKEGRMQMMRRPIPDIAVFDTDGTLCGKKTIDGCQDYGVIEHNVRPGYYDNSHVGPNAAAPARANILGKEVYVDITHGVYNPALAEDGDFYWKMRYSPFFRVKDAQSGDLLYYSDGPILDDEAEMWSEYSRYGRWIQSLTHSYITFVGGQTPVNPEQTGVDDLFTFYTGVGDTAICRGEFTLRELLPEKVLADIGVHDAHAAIPVTLPENAVELPERPAGWNWRVRNDAAKRCVAVERSFTFPQGTDCAVRPIYTRPGYFDADLMVFDGKSIVLHPELGYCLFYHGLRWTEEAGVQKTEIGLGVLVLDEDDPERVYYRSFTSILPAETREGFVTAPDLTVPEGMLGRIRGWIPDQVQFEIRRSRELVRNGQHWKSEHTIWLEERTKI